MIKLFTESDFSKIISLWERSVEATHHFLAKEDLEFYKSLVPRFFPQVNAMYILEEDGIIKGFLGVSEEEIDMLFVDSKYFGQGIGKQLLMYAIEELKLSKIDVNEQNMNAYEFYQHFGFRLVGRTETDGFGKPYPILHLEL